VFTTLSEVDDPIILYGFLGGFALNVMLAAQMLFYWNSGKKLAAKPKKQQFSARAATPVGKSPKPKSGRKKA
jgi:mannose-P-dolichol utilization defect protein 1